jgi:excisionase family DNA binding protein
LSSSTNPPRRSLTDDALLDAPAVAELLHMRLSTVLDLARRGVVPGHKLGRRWVFLRDELEASVRAAPRQPPPLVRPVSRPHALAERPVEPSRRRARALPSSQSQLFGPDLGV